MNAAIAIDKPTNVGTTRAAKDSAHVEPEAKPSSTGFGAAQIRAVGLSMLAVFAAVTAAMTAYNGQFWAAAGVAFYLSIWLGGGFGFLIGGISWSLGQEDSQH